MGLDQPTTSFMRFDDACAFNFRLPKILPKRHEGRGVWREVLPTPFWEIHRKGLWTQSHCCLEHAQNCSMLVSKLTNPSGNGVEHLWVQPRR